MPRRGTSSASRKANALDLPGAKQAPARPGTRPSLGPETRARHLALVSGRQRGESRESVESLESETVTSVSLVGKPAKAGGTNGGAGVERANARLAADYRSRVIPGGRA